MKLHFYIRFHTKYRQSLWISANNDEFGNNDPVQAKPLEYLNNDYWHGLFEIKRKELPKNFIYSYILRNEDGEFVHEWGHDRHLPPPGKDINEITLVDTWNHAGEYENAFYSAPFKEVLLKQGRTKKKISHPDHTTHIFKVKAPLLQPGEILCLLGSHDALGNWEKTNPVPMEKQDHWWVAHTDLSGAEFPVAYKYGVFDTGEKKFLRYENGDNRILYQESGRKKLTVLHDGFIYLPNNTWKGAGVAIPVFSLRSRNSFGVGEFNDIRLLADWAKATGLKLIQLLPVNDTIANHNWLDSYPYAAISAFALHPLYINLPKVAGDEHTALLRSVKKKQTELNQGAVVDYEEVIKHKLAVLRELYDLLGTSCFESDEYKKFFRENRQWLQPYAAFCYFRDRYGSSHFNEWPDHGLYKKKEIDKLFETSSSVSKELGLYCFIQFHLHIQLKEAVDYTHRQGVVLKGDIPIGIYRNGCDAWVAPEMYNMCWQAGAPPDDFTAVGQNWGFPTYNWKKMQEDGFSWWKQRFGQMSNYFDAFRIDHILGFFRIWSIPAHAVQGIMGRFVPCLPVHINEFGENGVWLDYQRYCRPFITDEVLEEIFGGQAGLIREQFLESNDNGTYNLKPEFETQRQVEQYFSERGNTETDESLMAGLFDLVSNVILFEEEGSQGEHFHFRISMEKTASFRHLVPYVQEKLRGLYINYFYRRQDDFWFREAMHKLPQLKAATNMLVCGEDLGMVPHCVPDVMQQLGILSLEIQRMPKDPQKEFFHPDDAPYMSVITPSTHDMSTIRGWWEENRERTQHFYNSVMEQWGEAPQYCESWINRAIILQHLYSPAMWSIFQLQDILGMSETLRRPNPQDERINNPANPKNYWQYRMHLNLEDLVKEKAFNEELRGYIQNSGRG